MIIPLGSDLINRLDYNYTTLTHRLGPLGAGLSSQKRPASSLSESEDGPQSKRQSSGVSAATPKADSSITESVDTSSPSQPVESSQPQRRCMRASAKTPDACSFTTQSSDSPCYLPPRLAQQVYQNPWYQEIEDGGFRGIASQPSCCDYGNGSGDGEIPSVNQNPELQEIGASKCVDNASQSTSLDSTYGSRDCTIPSTSGPHAHILQSVPPKIGRGDSGIVLSGNTSVFMGPPATGSHSGSAVRDVSNPVPPQSFDPASLDPNLPSNMISREQQSYFGFEPEGLLNSNLYGYPDHHG